MTPPRVVARFLEAAAPFLILPGRNRSVEYNHVPGLIATYLEKGPVCFIQDEAGFIRPDELAKDVVRVTSTRMFIKSREAERGENLPLAAALAAGAKDAEKHLDVVVAPIVSPKTGKKGWKVTARPEVRDLYQKVEYQARGEG